jgi:biopolymer transport protein ExbB/TolQ
MIDLFLKGGLLMYPLAFRSLISLAGIIEKAVQLWVARTDLARAEVLLQAAAAGELARAEALAKEDPRPVGRLLGPALAGRQVAWIDLENRLSRLGSGEL